jgi:hypothetical protein
MAAVKSKSGSPAVIKGMSAFCRWARSCLKSESIADIQLLTRKAAFSEWSEMKNIGKDTSYMAWFDNGGINRT